MKQVLWFSWRSWPWVVKVLFQGARRCTTGAALFQRAGKCTAGAAACDESFHVKIPVSDYDGGNRFLPRRS